MSQHSNLDIGGERQLMAAILESAREDCARKGAAAAHAVVVPAFAWIVLKRPWMRCCCQALDLDPDRVRERFVSAYGDRVLMLISKARPGLQQFLALSTRELLEVFDEAGEDVTRFSVISDDDSKERRKECRARVKLATQRLLASATVLLRREFDGLRGISPSGAA